MIETALVFDRDGFRIAWHEPHGRSGGAIPDSRELWELLWANRTTLGGVAHTHPWQGPSAPSATDVSTFAAVEAGLGKRLIWPVVTFSEVSFFEFDSASKTYTTSSAAFAEQDHWLESIEQLRRKSRGE